MREIYSLLRQLDDEGNIPSIRVQIVDLIYKFLDRRRASLDNWEKMHFANAIGSLLLTVDSLRQPRMGWLRLCLSDLQLALIPKAERDPGNVARDLNAEELSVEQLLKALDSIARKIGAPR